MYDRTKVAVNGLQEGGKLRVGRCDPVVLLRLVRVVSHTLENKCEAFKETKVISGSYARQWEMRKIFEEDQLAGPPYILSGGAKRSICKNHNPRRYVPAHEIKK